VIPDYHPTRLPRSSVPSLTLEWITVTPSWPVHKDSNGQMGALKTQVLENASTEKASTKQRISQGWKTQVRKMQVGAYNANLQSDKKKFGTSQVSVVHFQVEWASVFFSKIT